MFFTITRILLRGNNRWLYSLLGEFVKGHRRIMTMSLCRDSSQHKTLFVRVDLHCPNGFLSVQRSPRDAFYFSYFLWCYHYYSKTKFNVKVLFSRWFCRVVSCAFFVENDGWNFLVKKNSAVPWTGTALKKDCLQFLYLFMTAVGDHFSYHRHKID